VKLEESGGPVSFCWQWVKGKETSPRRRRVKRVANMFEQIVIEGV
jgi:hypothetical protein